MVWVWERDPILLKFESLLIYSGKKQKSVKLLKKIAFYINIMSNKNPLHCIHAAVLLVSPFIFVLNIRKNSAIIQVPVPVSTKKSYFISINWLITSARQLSSCSTCSFAMSLALSIIQTILKQGSAIVFRNNLHNKALVNRTFLKSYWGYL
jgi:small subunit ribosomal protein S7